MRELDEMQIALMKNQFRRMYQDIGFDESLAVLNEILTTANLLVEVIIDEKQKESKEGQEGI